MKIKELLVTMSQRKFIRKYFTDIHYAIASLICKTAWTFYSGSTFLVAYVYIKVNAEQRLECQCPPYCSQRHVKTRDWTPIWSPKNRVQKLGKFLKW